MIEFQTYWQRASGMADYVRRRPGWVTRTAAAVALIVIVVPIVALALAGALAFAVVFVTLGAIATVMNTVRAACRHPRAGIGSYSGASAGWENRADEGEGDGVPYPYQVTLAILQIRLDNNSRKAGIDFSWGSNNGLEKLCVNED